MRKKYKTEKKLQEIHAEGRTARWLSSLLVLLAAGLLGYVCSVCCPQLSSRAQALFSSARENSAVQAFSSLSRALKQGDGIVEAFAESYEAFGTQIY